MTEVLTGGFHSIRAPPPEANLGSLFREVCLKSEVKILQNALSMLYYGNAIETSVAERYMARGPAYPFVDLEQAVGFVTKMYQYSRRSPAQADAVIRDAWKYSPTSSGSQKTLAALKYFGLIDELANNDGRVIKISDRAYRIIIDEANSIERRQALRDAALSPKAYLLCWNKWGAELPASMRSTLLFDEGFIDSTVDSFIADYKKSIEFAGLLEESSHSEITSADDSERANEGSQSIEAIQSKQVLAGTSTTIKHDDQYRNDLFSLAEGTVTLVWPKLLSAESYQDLSEWLDLMKRKIERTVLAKPNTLG